MALAIACKVAKPIRVFVLLAACFIALQFQGTFQFNVFFRRREDLNLSASIFQPFIVFFFSFEFLFFFVFVFFLLVNLKLCLLNYRKDVRLSMAWNFYIDRNRCISKKTQKKKLPKWKFQQYKFFRLSYCNGHIAGCLSRLLLSV